MISPWQNRMAKLRGLFAVLAILIGSFSGPVIFASTLPDVCSMTCCVEEGHCCCSPRRASVKGQAQDGTPRLSEAEVLASCPGGCANSTASSNLLLRVANGAAIRPVESAGSVEIYFEQVASDHLFVDLDSFSPRGPPLSLTPVA